MARCQGLGLIAGARRVAAGTGLAAATTGATGSGDREAGCRENSEGASVKQNNTDTGVLMPSGDVKGAAAKLRDRLAATTVLSVSLAPLPAQGMAVTLTRRKGFGRERLRPCLRWLVCGPLTVACVPPLSELAGTTEVLVTGCHRTGRDVTRGGGFWFCQPAPLLRQLPLQWLGLISPHHWGLRGSGGGLALAEGRDPKAGSCRAAGPARREQLGSESGLPVRCSAAGDHMARFVLLFKSCVMAQPA